MRYLRNSRRTPFRLPRQLRGRQKRVRERGLELIPAGEVRNAVAVVFAKVAHLDEVIDDVAHVLALVQAPLFQDEKGHRAVLI